MFNHLVNFFTTYNGPIYALLILVLSYVPKFNKITEAHLEAKKATQRNAHELSLMRAADRIIPSVIKVARASKKDRVDEAVSQLAIYANERGIHLDTIMAKHFINKALSKYKANGGNVPETIKATIE